LELKQGKLIKFIRKIVELFRKAIIIILIKAILMKSPKERVNKKRIASFQKIISKCKH
jgi:hypothetical protein